MPIFNYLVCIIEYYLLFDFLSIFFEKRKNNPPWVKLLLTFVSASLLYLFNLLQIFWLNPVVSLLILILSSLILFDSHLQSIVVLSLFDVAALVVYEFIGAAVLSFLMNDKAIDILETDRGLIIGIMISKTLLMLSNRLVRTYVSRRRQTSNYTMTFVFLSPVVALYIMYSLLEFDEYLPQTPRFSLWLGSIYTLLLIVNLVVFHIYDEQQKSYDLRLELRSAERFQEQQEKILQINQSHMDELALLTHDFKNHLITIQSLIIDDPLSATDYISDLTGKLIDQKKKSINYTNNPIVNGILTYIQKECESNQIEMKTEVNFCNLSFLNHSDSCAIFSNALDNALTACLNARNHMQQAYIHITIAQYQNTITIGIKNSKLPSDLIINNNGQFISTKPNQQLHGYGIRNMKQTVERYNGSIVFDYSENEFCVTIIMPSNMNIL